MNSKKIFSFCLALFLIATAMTALAHPRRPATPSDAGAQPRYQLAERMCAGSRTQSDAVTVTRWTEWLGDGNTRWQLPLLRAHLRTRSTASIRTQLVHGTCGASVYQLDPITSHLRYPHPDGRLRDTPRTSTVYGIPDTFGYGGLGSGTGWGGGGTGESTIGMGGVGTIGDSDTAAPACNTAVITFEARFLASDWCGVTQGVPDNYIEGTARVIGTRPAYRVPPTRRH